MLFQLIAKAPKLAEYQAYVDFELKIGDPARIQQIYERALVENCLVSDLWVRYIQYLVSASVSKLFPVSCPDEKELSRLGSG